MEPVPIPASAFPSLRESSLDLAHHLGAGGFEIELAPDMVVRTPNITPDQETGVGKWSDADIKKAITEGIDADGGHLSPPMPYSF